MTRKKEKKDFSTKSYGPIDVPRLNQEDPTVKRLMTSYGVSEEQVNTAIQELYQFKQWNDAGNNQIPTPSQRRDILKEVITSVQKLLPFLAQENFQRDFADITTYFDIDVPGNKLFSHFLKYKTGFLLDCIVYNEKDRFGFPLLWAYSDTKKILVSHVESLFDCLSRLGCSIQIELNNLGPADPIQTIQNGFINSLILELNDLEVRCKKVILRLEPIKQGRSFDSSLHNILMKLSEIYMKWTLKYPTISTRHDPYKDKVELENNDKKNKTEYCNTGFYNFIVNFYPILNPIFFNKKTIGEVISTAKLRLRGSDLLLKNWYEKLLKTHQESSAKNSTVSLKKIPTSPSVVAQNFLSKAWRSDKINPTKDFQ